MLKMVDACTPEQTTARAYKGREWPMAKSSADGRRLPIPLIQGHQDL